MVVYTPDSNKIVHKTKVDFQKRFIKDTVHLVQYDSKIPVIEVSLQLNGSVYTLPNDIVSVKVRWGLHHKTVVYKDVLGTNINNTVVYFDIDSEMTLEHGIYETVIELIVTSNEQTITVASSSIIFKVDVNPVVEMEA